MRVALKIEEFKVKIGEEVIEQEDAIKYLGAMISSDGSVGKDWECNTSDGKREELNSGGRN